MWPPPGWGWMDKAAKAELVMSKAGVSMDKAANARLSRRVTATS